ncbi:MAG: hypothetical protein AB7Q23_03115 [Hyphomonadaceae bacterium]
MKRLLTAAAICLCCAATAVAQEAAAPPAVETMTCEQMTAELGMAGAQMNRQLDPEFAREAQAQQQAAQGGQAQEGSYADQAARNRARHDAQMGRLQDSMAGLDQARLMAMAQRFEQLRCETPQ